MAKVILPAIANLGGCHGSENKQNSRKMDFWEKNLIIGPNSNKTRVLCQKSLL